MLEAAREKMRLALARLFTDPFETRIADATGVGDIFRDITPVMIVPSNLARGAAVPPLMDTSNRVPVHELSATDLSATPLMDSGNVAGNAAGTATLTASVATDIWEIEAVVMSYLADANASARSAIGFTLDIQWAPAGVAIPVGARKSYTSPTISLAANQGGFIMAYGNQLEVSNANGVVARASAGHTYPMKTDGTFAVRFAAATLGLAGDVQRVQVFGRKVS